MTTNTTQPVREPPPIDYTDHLVPPPALTWCFIYLWVMHRIFRCR